MGVQELIKKSESYLALLSSNQSNSAQVNKLSDELLTLIKVRFLTNNIDTCAAQIEKFLYISTYIGLIFLLMISKIARNS